MLQKTVQIINKLGLHARASAKFVACASQFQSELQVKKGIQVANGKSIMGIMMLAANKNTLLELCVDGPDEQSMLDAIVALIERRFDEAE